MFLRTAVKNLHVRTVAVDMANNADPDTASLVHIQIIVPIVAAGWASFLLRSLICPYALLLL